MSLDYFLLCDGCRVRHWLCSHKEGDINTDGLQDFVLEHSVCRARLVSEDADPEGAPSGYWKGSKWEEAE